MPTCTHCLREADYRPADPDQPCPACRLAGHRTGPHVTCPGCREDYRLGLAALRERRERREGGHTP